MTMLRSHQCSSWIVLVLAGIISLSAPGTAAGAFKDRGDESPRWASVSFRLGWWFPPPDGVFAQVHGEAGKPFWNLGVSFVPLATRVQVLVGASIGLHQKTTSDIDLEDVVTEDQAIRRATERYPTSCACDRFIEEGDTTIPELTLLVMPMRLETTVMLDPLPEFPVSPLGRIGLDLFSWEERWIGGKEWGSEGAWHWAAGIALLLDVLAPAKAQRVDEQYGINDVYFVIEARRTYNLGREEPDIDFSGWGVAFSLQVDI